MGFQSRRFRASETVDSELVYLCLLLFLCVGFQRRPANYGHTYHRDYRGALNLEQGTSEVFATANSARNEYGSVGKYGSTPDFLAEMGHELDHLGPHILLYDHSLDRLKLDSSGDVLALNLFPFDPNETRFVQSFEDGRYHLRLRSGQSAFDRSINDTLLRHESIGIMGKKKLGRVQECFNKTVMPHYAERLSRNNDLELGAKVISIILSGMIIFAIILAMACKRIRNMILFKSNNELDALIFEEFDLDKSYLADQILYENLMKGAVLISSKGSSGNVFKVRFLEMDCAMKVFHSNARMDFRKESITLLNLSHPHVVKYFCSFRKPFIIMELMDEDLYSFITKIQKGRIDYDMPFEVALDVMLQIAKGMSYLHRLGIAHQDLKSLNILLKLRGEFDDPDFQIIAKVADLGSARRFNPRYPKGFVLVPNMNIGTRLWRAPELFDSGEDFMSSFLGVNPRVLPKPLDIYGFAVICSELLTKQVPFSHEKDLRVAVLASKLREGHRPALPSTGCPEGLLSLIKDCWHGDPVLRPEFHEVCTRLIEVKSSWMSRGQRPER